MLSQETIGPLVGEGSVEVPESTTLTVNTVVVKIDNQYTELQKNCQSLEAKPNSTKTLTYLLVATTIAFLTTTLYFARKKKQSQICPKTTKKHDPHKPLYIFGAGGRSEPEFLSRTLRHLAQP